MGQPNDIRLLFEDPVLALDVVRHNASHISRAKPGTGAKPPTDPDTNGREDGDHADENEPDDVKPDLGLRYLEAGHALSTFTITRFSLSMLARVDEQMYTTTAILNMEQVYALSIDFDKAQFRRLLSLAPTGKRISKTAHK